MSTYDTFQINIMLHAFSQENASILKAYKTKNLQINFNTCFLVTKRHIFLKTNKTYIYYDQTTVANTPQTDYKTTAKSATN